MSVQPLSCVAKSAMKKKDAAGGARFVQLEFDFSSCDRCGVAGASRYRQNTRYKDDKQNFVKLCPCCKEENDEYWAAQWSEYYHGRL